jgi:hypothetical protein
MMPCFIEGGVREVLGAFPEEFVAIIESIKIGSPGCSV